MDFSGSLKKTVQHLYNLVFAVVWIFMCIYFINLIGFHYGFTKIGPYCQILNKIVGIALLIGFSFWFKVGIEKKIYQKRGGDIHSRIKLFLDRLLTVTVLMISVIFIFQIFGFDVTSILALGGIGVVGLGLAAKDIVSNFCSGFLFNMTTPFIVGDYILVLGKNIEGRIEEIGWFWVVVRNEQKGAAYFPHTCFANDVVMLLSHRSDEIKIDSK